jgi:hypothetical protein
MKKNIKDVPRLGQDFAMLVYNFGVAIKQQC